eukprot:TRINITY_DN82785_c0_g1_i1.p2 TRINITY_DN82785_c0_g1~~TRINITY_DN82785_c0_g1_i1.p2  ORF type:complete len:250 (-),score=14.34 TRINITY_DN82785_c0_g1_i1:63-812(-)
MSAQKRLNILHNHLKSNNHSHQVVVVGAVVIDINATPMLGQIPQPGGSVPGKVSLTFGGVGHNIAATLSILLKQSSKQIYKNLHSSDLLFMTVLGEDDLGNKFQNYWEEQIDQSSNGIQIVPNTRTPSVCTIFGSQGEVVASIADINTFVDVEFLKTNLKVFLGAKVIIIDGNLSSEVIDFMCNFAKVNQINVWYEPVSVPKSIRCISSLGKLFCISPNLNEFKQIASQLNKEPIRTTVNFQQNKLLPQ